MLNKCTIKFLFYFCCNYVKHNKYLYSKSFISLKTFILYKLLLLLLLLLLLYQFSYCKLKEIDSIIEKKLKPLSYITTNKYNKNNTTN